MSRTANRTILHFWSADVLYEVLTLANDCVCYNDIGIHNFRLCGKVDFLHSNTPGYIITETEDKLKIMYRNRMKTVNKVNYIKNKDETITISNKLILAYNVSQDSNHFLGNLVSSELVLKWVYPISIIITRNRYNNFRILAPFYAMKKVSANNYKLDKIKSSYKSSLFYSLLINCCINHNRKHQIINLLLKCTNCAYSY